MIQEAVYSNGQRTLRASIERCEVLLKSDGILTFPRIIELEGDHLVLAYGRNQHGGGNEKRFVALSDDLGRTWTDQPPGHPFCDNLQMARTLGHLRDGTIVYLDCDSVNVDARTSSAAGTQISRSERRSAGGVQDAIAQRENPTFTIRRFSRSAELLDESVITIQNLPWNVAHCGRLVESDNGDLLAALMATKPASDPPTPHNIMNVFIIRSTDGGKTFEFVWQFDEFGPDDVAGRTKLLRRPWTAELGLGDQHPKTPYGTCEPDIEVLANGDILCMMRTGSGSSMVQSRSTDNGQTWSSPVSIGWPGVRPELRLLSNGVLACSSGRGLYGLPQVTYAMFSLEGAGETWEHPMAFHTGPGCSYTSNMERGGKLYITYSHSSFTQPEDMYDLPYHSIKWVVIDFELSG